MMASPDSTQQLSWERKKAARPVEVIFEEEGRTIRKRFTTRFLIGRGQECHVVVSDDAVSRLHAEVVVDRDRWWIRDLQSTNGTFIDGECIERRSLGTGKTKARLGPEGPVVSLEVLEEDPSGTTILSTLRSVPSHILRLTGIREDRTKLVRRVVESALHKQSRRYVRIISVLAALALVAVAYALFNHARLERQREVAENVFYELKELELAYARLESELAATRDSAAVAASEGYLERRELLLENYEKYVSELGIYSADMSEQERVIYRVARIFGECEIGMPPGFTKEVLRYVDEWKKSSRLRRSLERAESLGYPEVIRQAMLEEHMTPLFFYLCLQESEFDSTACGPQTRFGIAKGMWQFIPATAIQYGLRTGPLVHLPRPDPKDQRHQVRRSTEAAARYLRDIYNTEAQASGLLVIAAYNWGHNAVRGLIRKLPENPRERNFWKFLQHYRSEIPSETYNYVFYIISAAVIGERPELFGFDVPPPFAESQTGS
jgi:membrane-bound lytic murein transglycosylase D